MRLAIALGPLLILGCASAPAPGGVVGADADRREAQVAAHPAALERVLHESLVYKHSDGREESKSELIASLVDGTVDYREIRVSEIEAMTCGGPQRLCLRARQVLEVTFEGRDYTVPGCYVAVYEGIPRALQLIHYQSANLDAGGGCPL
jgi:hypothetical protein